MNPNKDRPAASEEHTVGGKAVADAFPDRRLKNLARAACAGNVAAIKEAINVGGDPNGVGLDGVTPLVWAQDCESLAGVQALLEAGANPNASFGGCSSAAVCFAARMSNPAFLKLLLSHGGDPDACCAKGETALWLAFNTGLDRKGWDNYYALLSAGADINRLHDNHTVAEFAVNMNSFDKVAELLERGYTTRLDYLGWMAQEHSFGGSPNAMKPIVQDRDRVIEMLKSRGVAFPIASRPPSAPDFGKQN